MGEQKKLTTASGIPYYHNEDSMSAGPKREEIINRQLCHFFRADIGLGMSIAQALGIDMNSMQQHIPQQRPDSALV